MRLGKISKLLNVSNEKIINFCKEFDGTIIENNPNVKVSENLILELQKFFGNESMIKDNEIDVIAEINEDFTEEIKQEIIVETNKKETPELQEATEEHPLDDESLELEKELNLVDGVIKSPKVNLPGPKVVGKIELPNKKTTEKDESLDTDKPKDTELDTKKVKKKNVRKHKKSSKISMTYEEKQKLEQEKLQDEIKNRKQKEKEKKRKHYEKNVQQRKSQNLKKSSNNNKKKAVNSQQNNKTEKPKTLWGKFIFWLNN